MFASPIDCQVLAAEHGAVASAAAGRFRRSSAREGRSKARANGQAAKQELTAANRCLTGLTPCPGFAFEIGHQAPLGPDAR
jgi:hypothetical protein